MNLSYRTMRPHDCAECFQILTYDDGFSRQAWNQLPKVWASLFNVGAINAIVVVDNDRPVGHQIVQLGMSVFVSDSFLVKIKTEPTDSLSAKVIEAHLSGNSPILNRRQIAVANAKGRLNLIVLEAVLLFDGMSESERRSLAALGPETFFYVHAGFQIDEIVIQPPNDQFRSFSISSGFRERQNWNCNSQSRKLIGITRREADSQPGLYIARLFVFQPPRFGFNAGEQDVLSSALGASTDAEIAKELSVAVATVKSRWRSIYDKATIVLLSSFREAIESCPPDERRRAAEKRRRLLSYIRLHPEELRPYLRS